MTHREAGCLKAKKLTASPKGLLVDQRDALALLADAGPEDAEKEGEQHE